MRDQRDVSEALARLKEAVDAGTGGHPWDRILVRTWLDEQGVRPLPTGPSLEDKLARMGAADRGYYEGILDALRQARNEEGWATSEEVARIYGCSQLSMAGRLKGAERRELVQCEPRRKWTEPLRWRVWGES